MSDTYAYHQASRVERFEVSALDPGQPAKPEEKSGVLSCCRSRVFRRVNRLKVLRIPLCVALAFLFLLTGSKWLTHPKPEHEYIAPLLVLAGWMLMMPSVYWLADLLGLIDDLGNRPRPIVRDEENYDSQLEEN